MAIAKERIRELIESQPEDATYEEILREFAVRTYGRAWSGGFPSGPCDIERGNGTSHPLMAEIRWTTEAEIWLKDIYDYIAQDDPSAAARVLAGIYEKAQVLKEYPEIGYRYRSEPQGEIRHIALWAITELHIYWPTIGQLIFSWSFHDPRVT